MQGRNENILPSTNKINAFQKKVTIWKKRIAAGNLEIFPSTPSSCPKFSALTTIKHKRRAQLLSVEDELRVCLSKTRPNLKELCKKHQAHVSH